MKEDFDDFDYEKYMDAAYDEYMEDLFEQEATARVQEALAEDDMVAVPAIHALHEAGELVAHGHPTAAVVFAGTAVELALKVAFLIPLVRGHVTSEAIARIVTDLAVKQMGMNRLRNLIANVAREQASLELDDIRRAGAADCLWNEVLWLRQERNQALHRGHCVEEDDARRSIDIAESVLNDLIKPVLHALGFHLHEEGRLCRSPGCNGTGE